MSRHSFNPYLRIWFGEFFVKQKEFLQESALGYYSVDFNRIVLERKFG